ncbi:hypothetical protein SKAU_G00363740 [Synaphobranchus kaupii]|uniref:Uncharacterized protein n=1 Tax=Synaphobranchus kaupii TaxID=118154 RepID=A0A9Q1EIY0_SYNKA|nr:hypothetical protein SKAU_G00363740 [Synaphobranchus kaupii]
MGILALRSRFPGRGGCERGAVNLSAPFFRRIQTCNVKATSSASSGDVLGPGSEQLAGTPDEGGYFWPLYPGNRPLRQRSRRALRSCTLCPTRRPNAKPATTQ